MTLIGNTVSFMLGFERSADPFPENCAATPSATGSGLAEQPLSEETHHILVGRRRNDLVLPSCGTQRGGQSACLVVAW
jgi:hypothetical protein